MSISYISPFIFFIFFSTLFVACDNQATVSKIDNRKEPQIEKEALPRLFMETQTRRLRVRETPDLEGTVLHILSDGVLVEFLYDSTNFTTEIVYNRKTYNANWYKIQTVEKIEGWVYAPFVKFLSKTKNQKVVTQRETAELLEAANEQQPKISKKQQKEMQQPVNKELLANYKNYLSKLDKNNPKSIGLAISRYNSIFINYANQNTHDAVYVAFHDFYTQVLQVLRTELIFQFRIDRWF